MTGSPNTSSRDPIALAQVAANPSIEAAVAAVRDFLEMEVAFASEFVGDHQVLRQISGDTESFGGVAVGASVPSSHLYCRRIIAGELPRLITDVRGHELARLVPITDMLGIGAFVSVPITLSDGDHYGTLCAASRHPEPRLEDRDVQFLHVLARMIGDQVERERLTRRTRELEVQAAAVTTLSVALAARDGYTGDHSEAVVRLAVEVGRQLGLGEAELIDVERAALLHDIGKLAIPDAILHKDRPLDAAEWGVMRRHPILGAQLIAGVPSLEHLQPVLRAEHERWDGGGYPDGLAGEAIPLPARIVFVCDAYHAMTSDRPYRRALGHECALAEIEAGAGSQFCPTTSRALLTVLAGDRRVAA
ncbi:MAG: hypothetical protein AVDCRST_MAG38-1994 [uncultured Solirubrobacteraceae bacterium]|uniref:Uncharacterized protein n=1 Tax=uncultured Solirubrobacteraceae bacterium TaxID=1162706 RepID=A0A6J4RT27_9ACTN|nr:MAG: hypothetical protein AVDCRST_MAG38-1994 [uncultured Solirubrobacteraceae bacterium]